MSDIEKLRWKNKRRLAKIHKLKQENRVLSSRRKSCYKEVKAWFSKYNNSGNSQALLWLNEINRISEKIGRNSAKILRLRTLIKQSEVQIEKVKLSYSFFQF